MSMVEVRLKSGRQRSFPEKIKTLPIPAGLERSLRLSTAVQ